MNKINATYKKKRKLIKQQEPIYFKLTEIQEADVLLAIKNQSGVGREFCAKMIEVKVAEVNAARN